MNKIYKVALVAAGAALAIQSAHAQANPNDLIIGFNGFSVAGTLTDYAADLGASSTILAGGPNESLSAAAGSVTLGSTTFTAPSYSSGLNVGVVGGKPGTTADVFMTTLRSGGTTFATPGTELAPPNFAAGQGSGNNIASAASQVGNIQLGDQASGSGNGNSFSQVISLAPSTTGSGNQNFVNFLYGGGSSGPVADNQSPLANFGASDIIVEDLWENTRSGANSTGWTYKGDITIDLSGSSPVVTFDAVAVPEPTTYGLIGGCGLLMLALRRQLGRSNA